VAESPSPIAEAVSSVHSADPDSISPFLQAHIPYSGAVPAKFLKTWTFPSAILSLVSLHDKHWSFLGPEQVVHLKKQDGSFFLHMPATISKPSLQATHTLSTLVNAPPPVVTSFHSEQFSLLAFLSIHFLDSWCKVKPLEQCWHPVPKGAHLMQFSSGQEHPKAYFPATITIWRSIFDSPSGLWVSTGDFDSPSGLGVSTAGDKLRLWPSGIQSSSLPLCMVPC